jgi:hypothetical protein
MAQERSRSHSACASETKSSLIANIANNANNANHEPWRFFCVSASLAKGDTLATRNVHQDH